MAAAARTRQGRHPKPRTVGLASCPQPESRNKSTKPTVAGGVVFRLYRAYRGIPLALVILISLTRSLAPSASIKLLTHEWLTLPRLKLPRVVARSPASARMEIGELVVVSCEIYAARSATKRWPTTAPPSPPPSHQRHTQTKHRREPNPI